MKKELVTLIDTIDLNRVVDTPLTDWLLIRVLDRAESIIGVVNLLKQREEAGERVPNYSSLELDYKASLLETRKYTLHEDKDISQLNEEVQILATLSKNALNNLPSDSCNETLHMELQPDFKKYWIQVKNRVEDISRYFLALKDFAEIIPYEALSQYNEIIDIEYLLRLYLTLR